jgi:protoheme ferro-lyase
MLFNNTRKKSHLHYGTPEKAKNTIRYLKTRKRGEQVRSAQAMYYRAMYHARQTPEMREAMKIYRKFLTDIKRP